MKRTSIYDLPELETYVFIELWTDKKNLKKRELGNAFYVWKEYHNGDSRILIFGKDISVDSNGNIYCCDGLDTILESD